MKNKSIFTTFLTIIFAIGFIASMESENSKEKSVDSKVPLEVEELTTIEPEKVTQLSTEEQKIADAGYEAGSIMGLAGSSLGGLSDIIKTVNYMDAMNNNSGETIRKIAAEQYDSEYQVPTNAKEESLKKIYVDNYIRGLNKAMKAMQ